MKASSAAPSAAIGRSFRSLPRWRPQPHRGLQPAAGNRSRILYRDAAAHRAGTLSKVGLGTFVDPRQGGGRINDATTEALVRLMEIDGEEWLFYKAPAINVALIRGTTADPAGNVTMEREALVLDAQAAAMAAQNANGLVIVQVERIAAAGSLDPRQVVVPGVLVDCVVRGARRCASADLRHRRTTPPSPARSRVPVDRMARLRWTNES